MPASGSTAGTYYLGHNLCPAGQVTIIAGTYGGATLTQTGWFLNNQNNADGGAGGGKVRWVQTFNPETACWLVSTPIQAVCRNAADGPYFNLRTAKATDSNGYMAIDKNGGTGVVSIAMPDAAPQNTNGDFCWKLPGFTGSS